MQPLKWEFRSNIWYYMWKKNLISKRIHLNIQSGRSRQPDLRLTDHIWSKTESQKCSTFETCSWPCQRWGGRLNEIFPKARLSNALGGWLTIQDDGSRDVWGSIFIGPESDHCLPLSLTHSLTHSLTDSVMFSELDWCDPGVWRCLLKTCWGCYCCWC